jgi:hypothetical protein
MVEHKCNKCGIVFYKKSHLAQHIIKKKPCVQLCMEINHSVKSPLIDQQKTLLYYLDHLEPPKNQQNININTNQIYLAKENEKQLNINDIDLIENNQNDNFCRYCYKNFCRKDVLNKHIKNNCKVKKEDDDKKEEIFRQLLLQSDLIIKKDEIIKDQQEKFNLLFEQNLKLIENYINID